MIECEIIETQEGLSSLKNEWSRLLAMTPHASFFQSWHWMEVRWKHRLESDTDLRVVVVRENREVIGIVPLVIQRRQTPLGAIRKLRFPIDNWGSFYSAVAGEPGRVMSEAAKHLRENRKDHDLLEFTNLPDYRSSDGKPSETRNPQLDDDAGPWEIDECSHVAMLYLSGDWESYWESRKAQKNRRRNVERCERRLGELGIIEYIRYRPDAGEDPRWDLYDQCEELASKSWQDGLADGNTLHHEDVRPFFRDAHLAAIKAGASDLNLLRLNGKPVAFSYGYHFRGYVDLTRVGFDPELGKFAPGNALWTRLIRDSYSRGDYALDFGPSCLDYKKFWMTTLETSYQAIRYAPTPAGRAFRLARTVKAKLPMHSADHTNAEAKEAARRKCPASVK